MKQKIFAISCVLTMVFGSLFSQNDTLYAIYEFNSPTVNPWGLTWDGTDLWISDNISGWIYKSSTNGQTLDSIEIENAQITGITFVDDTLWALNTKIIADTLINNSTYSVFSLYKIDKSNGQKIDSISIIGSATNLQSGDLWGLTYYNSKFYITYNGGWGPCLLEIDAVNYASTDLCCTHLAGMTIANDSIWAIRHGGNIITTTNGTEEYWKYEILFSATDITYDGNNFWVVDIASNKTKKMEGLALFENDNVKTQVNIQLFYNPTQDFIIIENDEQLKIKSATIFSLDGKLIKEICIDNNKSSQKINLSKVAKGVYIIKLNVENKEVNKLIIKN
ncbi:MAG: T9SS type A sorting domain-containing protein [Bacteroidetes bacterium]|jgi:hypothetical protein|nr:T9SS type A sorting domain-containing protein [Bacteroidota bacterium]MBT6688037.1 T9SS type A sorting domain-containing protein [Bacteroidota bacterium]MBT7145175.1 T9SS type A sorting domain-containing protein [Bacteroidota bacterium]MBT7490905.1 T9SS type A sorting domain-containing protein [Bacteroidota bacterium]